MCLLRQVGAAWPEKTGKNHGGRDRPWLPKIGQYTGLMGATDPSCRLQCAVAACGGRGTGFGAGLGTGRSVGSELL